MLKLAYLNINFDIYRKEIKNIDNTLFVVSRGDFRNKRKIDIEDIISKCNIDKTIEYFEKYYMKNEKNIKINEFKELLTSYYEGLLDGLKLAFENNVIESVVVFYPFFRISNISNEVVLTYFTLINYFNNKKEFWVTEAIPDISELNDSKDGLSEYINSIMFEVRSSIFANSKIYNYLPEEINDNKINIINNYILGFFIELNFGIDISKLNAKLSISSFGEMQPNINIRRNKIKDIMLDENILILSIKKYNSTYYEYVKLTSNNLYFYEIVRTMYKSFVNLSRKKHYNPIDEIRKRVIAGYLSKVKRKEKISFKEDINLLIKKESGYVKQDILDSIALTLGTAYGGYKNTQQ